VPTWERYRRAKTARALVFVLIGTVQSALVPRHEPLQVLSLHPLVGFAVKRSGLYEVARAEQRPGHAIPTAALRTVPLPDTATVSRYVSGAKRADTLVGCFTETKHCELPEQAPPKRTSLKPGVGLGVSSSLVSAFQVVVQLCAHCSPGTSAVTLP
jgi:hypothetical protein